MLLMKPSLIAAPTSVELIDFATDIDIHRVASLLPSS